MLTFLEAIMLRRGRPFVRTRLSKPIQWTSPISLPTSTSPQSLHSLLHLAPKSFPTHLTHRAITASSACPTLPRYRWSPAAPLSPPCPVPRRAAFPPGPTMPHPSRPRRSSHHHHHHPGATRRRLYPDVRALVVPYCACA